jgi:hypothetical protein
MALGVANTPVGQDAYQAILMQRYAAAWNPFVKTVNRYTAGPSNNVSQNLALPQMPQRRGRMWGGVPVAGCAMLLGNSGGGVNYVVNDLVTFAPVNGGRSIVGKVLAVTGGNPTSIQILDPGSGLLGGGTGVSATTAQTAALTQLSTTGIGSGATWSATIGVGWGQGPIPRPDA